MQPRKCWQQYADARLGVSLTKKREELLRNIIKDARRPILNVGSNRNFFGCEINVDIARVRGLDVICDIRFLPFRKNSFNCVVCAEVIEHVKERESAVLELLYVCRGKVHLTFPSQWPYFDVILVSEISGIPYLNASVNPGFLFELGYVTSLIEFEPYYIHVTIKRFF